MEGNQFRINYILFKMSPSSCERDEHRYEHSDLRVILLIKMFKIMKKKIIRYSNSQQFS